METATGIVQDITDRTATVAVDAPVVCPRCAAGKGCGAGIFMQDERQCELNVSLPDGMSLRPGDTVTLAVSPRYLLRAAVCAYGMPLAGLLIAAGFAWGTGIAGSDLSAAIWVAGGLIIGVLAGRRLASTTAACQQLMPQIDTGYRER